MTLAVITLFATCIVAGTGFTFLSGLDFTAEERFFSGWILGIVALTLVAMVTTRMFTFDGPAVALGAAITLALSLIGWRRATTWPDELADLRRRVATPPWSGENPLALLVLLIPVWILVGRMFHNAYTIAEDGSVLVGHLASFSDWQAHLTYTASFAYAENTALNLPLAAGYNIGYHGGTNLFSALLVEAGTSLPGSLQLGGAFTLFAFPGVMYCVGMRVFHHQATALLGTLLFLFFGGWGWIELFRDIGDSAIDVWPKFPHTYTRAPRIEEGNFWLENPIVGHFFPQRPTLIGFPVVVMVLGWLHSAWTTSTPETPGRDLRPFVFCGVVVGLVPFFNLFAFGTPLAFAVIWWLMTRFDRRWLWFLVPAVVLALPMVVFLQPPSSSLEVPYDWVAHISNPVGVPDDLSLLSRVGNWLVFWMRNMGLFLPLLGAALVSRVLSKQIAIGLIPIWLFFFVPNVVKPHPWNGNNTHYFVIVLLIGSLPVAALLVSVVRRLPPSAFIVAPVVVTMVLAGMADVFATNGRVGSPYPVTAMDSAAVSVGEWARSTDPNSVFVIELGWPGGNLSPHQHPVPALSGRDVVIGNDGWVFDLGVDDWHLRKDHSRQILEAAPGWEQLAAKYGVDYLVVGPTETTREWDPNLAFWEEAADVVYRHAGWIVFEL